MKAVVPLASAGLIALAGYTGYKAYCTFARRPVTYPAPPHLARTRRAHPTAARLVCLGDSITQGDIGASYVHLLQKRLTPDAWIILNAGINGDLACNALARLGDVLAAQPAAITLLIGTNDVHAGMSPENHAMYVQLGKIKQPASFATYQANVAEILRRLQQTTPAPRIALMSIPLMSEDLDHEVNRRGDQYSDYLRELAGQLKITYLPLRETQKAFLQSTGQKGGQPYENTGRLSVTALAWSFLGLSWDRIAEHYGNQLSIDNLHSTSRTAQMIADLIEGFVQAQ